MKIIRRIFLAAAFLVFLLSIVLLLNITAPNPTHRRYSSETPVTARPASSQAIGKDGERILANDLRLPNNNDSGQRQLICNSSKPQSQQNCIVTLKIKESFRIPDFVAPTFLADSKNVQRLSFPSVEFDQISDDVVAALVTNRQVWVYVRANTDVASEFTRIVESTGGSIVYYFAVPGYPDPVDKAAQTSTAFSGAIILCAGALELVSRRRKVRVVVVEIPTGRPSPDKPIDSTSRKLDHAENFIASRKDRLRGQLNDDDVWGDDA